MLYLRLSLQAFSRLYYSNVVNDDAWQRRRTEFPQLEACRSLVGLHP